MTRTTSSKFPIHIPAPGAAPRARIPNIHVWDLVEYLSLQRTQVAYTYARDHFLVEFPHADPSTAQRLLDDWSRSRSPARTAATAPTPHAQRILAGHSP